ncbi:hypothetical protein [Pseudoalteromonas piscicida]|uniref:hypothetical protein n=1 Tax=Pseudoalteromonas piscicida TaxID=43662 RepID=UPI0027E43E36|nr:hypothetical protein [Pseudoalteromonas piscicida]WMO14852.1 hypothetical protein NI376_04320 [Pseudoalteromonas piscicida]
MTYYTNLVPSWVYEVIKNFDTNFTLQSTIERVLNDPNYLEEVAHKSFTHINGFNKIVLHSSDKPFGEIRLHNWLFGHVDGDIHNHAWDLCSFVISGSIVNETFKISEGKSFQRFTIGPVGGEEGYNLIKDGKVNLATKSISVVNENSFYTLSHDIVHQSKSLNGAVTLMVQSPFIRETSMVFRAQEQTKKSIEPMNKLEILRICETVLNAKPNIYLGTNDAC